MEELCRRPRRRAHEATLEQRRRRGAERRPQEGAESCRNLYERPLASSTGSDLCTRELLSRVTAV